MTESQGKNLKDFIISLNLKKNPVEELRYDQKDDELRVYITPKNKKLVVEDFEFSYDSGETDLESVRMLGSLMARLRFNKEKNVFWSALLAKDKPAPSIDLKDLAGEIRNHVSDIKILILFSEAGLSFAWAENKNNLQKLLQEYRGHFSNDHLNFSIDRLDFKNEINRILGLF